MLVALVVVLHLIALVGKPSFLYRLHLIVVHLKPLTMVVMMLSFFVVQNLVVLIDSLE